MNGKNGEFKVVSLFSGAGGLDIGFKQAGFDIIWANDNDKNSCESYKNNIGNHIRSGDIVTFKDELAKLDFNVDLLIGGPPCQGFSVAGKMDPKDSRSKHVWTYVSILKMLMPRAFILENVKALGTLEKWAPLKNQLLKEMRKLGYAVSYVIVNASDFNVPQARERVLFIGFKANSSIIPDLGKMLEPYNEKAPTVRQALAILDKAGTGNNIGTCKAKITLTNRPILRKSPFAGMLFNGLGRPVKLDGYCATLPASMGGNKTPIIDEEELYNNKSGWVQNYHSGIMQGQSPSEYVEAPARLRRLTVEEAAVIQTFPREYIFCGSQSSKFKQIGNAVPCNLAFQVAKMIRNYLNCEHSEKSIIPVSNYIFSKEELNADSYSTHGSRKEIARSVQGTM
jgi:DNA (cytosine-5)-methyltransferase 1